jgi:hypothetical protein
LKRIFEQTVALDLRFDRSTSIGLPEPFRTRLPHSDMCLKRQESYYTQTVSVTAISFSSFKFRLILFSPLTARLEQATAIARAKAPCRSRSQPGLRDAAPQTSSAIPMKDIDPVKHRRAC